MQYLGSYPSPLGRIFLAADEEGLTGLWFEGQKYFMESLQKERPGKELTKQNESFPVFGQARAWLDLYFSGREPDVQVPIHLIGTEFQMEVWEILSAIPYGRTVTYGKVAKELAQKRGIARMSAQAVGGAVGRNPVSVIVPCHRVIGSDGGLTGYAGGIDKKIALLKLEKAID